MKILICDDSVNLTRDIEFEVKSLKAALPNAEVIVHEFTPAAKEEFYELIADVDAVINTVVPFDREMISKAKSLKCIAQNGVGFNMIDVDAATEFGVMVCPAKEYCTEEVSEHTLALILAHYRGLRTFINAAENHIWDYRAAGELKRLSGQTIAVFGYGKIGQAVARKSRALGLKVLVVSGHLTDEKAAEDNVEIVDWKEAFERADIITNHMPLTEKSLHYFDIEKFQMAKNKPLFINTGRGASVNEEDLYQALEDGLLSGAGLDVLESEIINFEEVKFLGKDNIIITPHVAFYSGQSERDLQTISINSVIYAMTGQLDKISRILNREDLGL